MKVRKPKYYDAFKCIGSACQDTCCAGWEIEIDEETAQQYHSIGGEIGERLKENITETEEEIYFNLQAGKRCPFLNGDNLCDLILEIGEHVLCDICREHPRHYQWFGEYTEVGLGLCCEEAGRLLFQASDKITYVTEGEKEDSGEGADLEEEQEYIELLLDARETAYAIVQNREMKLEERFTLLLQYGEELQEAWDTDDFEALRFSTRVYQNQAAMTSAWKQMEQICGGQSSEPEAFGAKGTSEVMLAQGSVDSGQAEGDLGQVEDTAVELLRMLVGIYEKMESLDESWPERMQAIRQQLPELLENRTVFLQAYPNAEYEYEHFAVYLIYRYFMEALFDGDILGKVKFVIASGIILGLMDGDTYRSEGTFTLWNRIQNAKQYSKEIEYCTENMEAFGELCWQEDCLSVEGLTNLLSLGRKEAK